LVIFTSALQVAEGENNLAEVLASVMWKWGGCGGGGVATLLTAKVFAACRVD
jgi:hypothetical protein